MALALLVKPTAVFFYPLLMGVIWRHASFNWKAWLKMFVLGGLAVIPLYLWRQWILQFPDGIPASDWLFNGDGIRFRPAWWRWIFADRLGRLMFGYWGAPLVFFGVLPGMELKKRAHLSWLWFDGVLRENGIVLLGLAGMLAYVSIFATGNVRHDYYQILLVPVLSLAWARGVVLLVQQQVGWFQKMVVGVILAFVGLLSLVFSWYEIQGNFNVNNWAIVSAGNAVKKYVPEDSLIIANYNGDTTLLFATERRGWPIGFEIDQKIDDGAEFYITTAQDDEANMLMKKYTVIEATKEYILIDLRKPSQQEK